MSIRSAVMHSHPRDRLADWRPRYTIMHRNSSHASRVFDATLNSLAYRGFVSSRGASAISLLPTISSIFRHWQSYRVVCLLASMPRQSLQPHVQHTASSDCQQPVRMWRLSIIDWDKGSLASRRFYLYCGTNAGLHNICHAGQCI